MPRPNYELDRQSESRFTSIDSLDRLKIASKVAELAINMGQLTQDFRGVERIPRWSDGNRENDVEHSWMVEVAAVEMNSQLGLGLDKERIRALSACHDILEVKVGDVATFDLTPEQAIEKERRERSALKELLEELPPEMAKDLQEYEKQDSAEAIFVRMVDKLMPIAVNIVSGSMRILKEDFGISNRQALEAAHDSINKRLNERFGGHYPDLVAAHAALCMILEEKFELDSQTVYKPEASRSPTEIEVKYLISKSQIPESLDLSDPKLQRIYLRQGYVAVGADGSETRVRSIDDERFDLTIKSPGLTERDEQTMHISREVFDSLWLQTNGRQIEKTRYLVPFEDKATIELDIYHGKLEGLMTAEVEFEGRTADAKVKLNTFQPPEWFGENISEDLRYKNHNLAIIGIPHKHITLK